MAQTIFLARTLPVTGQGIVSLELVATGPFRIILSEEPHSTDGEVIVLEVNATCVRFRDADNNDPDSILAELAGAGVDRDELTSYWLSLDSQNRRLRYGKGYAQAQLTLLEWDFPGGDDPVGWANRHGLVAQPGDVARLVVNDFSLSRIWRRLGHESMSGIVCISARSTAAVTKLAELSAR